MIVIGLLTLHLQLPGAVSLKDKRSLVKPVLSRLHREFNISAAEVDHLDAWHETVIACILASNDRAYTQKALQSVLDFTEKTWPDLPILEHRIEII